MTVQTPIFHMVYLFFLIIQTFCEPLFVFIAAKLYTIDLDLIIGFAGGLKALPAAVALLGGVQITYEAFTAVGALAVIQQTLFHFSSSFQQTGVPICASVCYNTIKEHTF